MTLKKWVIFGLWSKVAIMTMKWDLINVYVRFLLITIDLLHMYTWNLNTTCCHRAKAIDCDLQWENIYLINSWVALTLWFLFIQGEFASWLNVQLNYEPVWLGTLFSRIIYFF